MVFITVKHLNITSGIYVANSENMVRCLGMISKYLHVIISKVYAKSSDECLKNKKKYNSCKFTNNLNIKYSSNTKSKIYLECPLKYDFNCYLWC
jgi:hypothetical protein